MTQFVTRITETNLNIFSVPSEERFIKFAARVDCTARQKLELRIFLQICWFPQLMSSSFDVRVHFRVARQRYFKCECKCCALPCFIQSAFHFGFLPSKPCFSLKSVPLNLCYTEAYHLWIGSFPADRCDRLIKSKTCLRSHIHPPLNPSVN